ncbi:PP2C family serine/threonine-protein phosphatase [Ruegeria sp. HKCCD8929]|uniref:PP2C family protein-serine/threonine phosphatase n=1 Tax=Ruegeria sp. HKCCD8929 TaxID=2683006 RepID=UPI001488B92D|nr:protein phosphatase 2C domain-containing protein [Ruegeria sp. HKCCD8929]
MLASPAYDIALLAELGQRDAQEDSIAARFLDAANAGYVVVADGMGGHDAGDVAAEFVTSSWRSMLDELLERVAPADIDLIDALPMAAMQANAAIANYVEDRGNAVLMGATLLGTLMLGDRLFWISIGDSPLYLFRNGKLVQINEDHSMAPLIDAQAANGQISADEAQSHPDRNQLTSVIMGAPIPKVDCPETPLKLARGDVLLIASDGLQYLDDERIQAVLQDHADAAAQDIADGLLQALCAVDHPDQDNISVAVVRPVNI